MITIDKNKCIGCGNCINKCVRHMLALEDGKATVIKDSGCIDCLHCAVACPTHAFSAGGRPAALEGGIPSLPGDFTMQLETLLKSRRSYRDFSEQKVPFEDIKYALDIAAWAPSAKNEHTVKYYVIDGRDKFQEMMDIIVAYLKETGKEPLVLQNLKNGTNSVFTTAQTLILAYSDGGYNPASDGTIAMAHAELILQSKGIGTCWAGYIVTFMNCIPALRTLLNVPKTRTFYAGMLVGYPKEKYYSIPSRIHDTEIIHL